MALKDIAPGTRAKLAEASAIGGSFELALDDLAALALIPYYCDSSVQFCIALRAPVKLDKKRLKVKFTLAGELEGATTIAIPGDGIYPPLLLFSQVAGAIADIAPPGTAFELWTANLGTVKRDFTVAAETSTTAGDQRFVGTIVDGRRLRIDRAFPIATVDALERAIATTRRVLTRGPWECNSRDEAAAAVRAMLDSAAANISEAFVGKTVRIIGSEITLDASWQREPAKYYALGMGLFRVRFANGPWDTRAAASDALGMMTEAQKDAVMARVLGTL